MTEKGLFSRRDEEEDDNRPPEENVEPAEPTGQDAPIAQGDARFSDVPGDISPGDEFVAVNPETDDIIDLSDVEDMEAYASIANTGNLPTVVDSDVEELDEYTADADIREDFAERQQLGGTDQLMDKLESYTQLSPEISGNDVDAAWQYADQAGEEGVGGSTPTPDQDVVDELGQALGIVYNDDEELNTEDKLDARDQDRWELKPESEDDRNADISAESDLDEDESL